MLFVRFLVLDWFWIGVGLVCGVEAVYLLIVVAFNS